MIKTIHNGRYLAEYDDNTARGVLLVITRPAGGGRYIEGPEATHWAEAISTAMDKREANALCKAILDSDGVA